MKHFSNNPKYNKVANEIYNDLLTIHETETESIDEINHYKKAFPKEPDFNLVQYGNMLIYYSDVRELFARCGYSAKHLARLSDSKIWEMYIYRVGFVVRVCF